MNDSRIREQQITRTSIIGIVTNVLLAAFKAMVGLVSLFSAGLFGLLCTAIKARRKFR